MLAVEQPDARHHGNRLGGEPRRHAAGLPAAARSASSSTSFYNTYKRDKFRTRLERGTEPGTVEIYISHRGMEQVPTTRSTTPVAGGIRLGGDAAQSRPRGARCLARLMVRFGTPEAQATRGRGRSRRPAPAPERARLEKSRDGATSSSSTTASTAPGGASAWRSTASASPSSTATARRACTSSATPIPTSTAKKDEGFLSKLHVLEGRRREKPEQYRIIVAEVDPTQPRHRAGSERRAGQDAERREDPRAALGPAQVERGARVRFASLGSGSEGNGLVVECGGTRVLIDCGFGVRDTAARLAPPRPRARSTSTAILVTHEHSDHVGGVPAFAARHGIAGLGDVRHARGRRRALRGHGARLRLRQPRRVRDRRARDRADSRAARRARAGPVRRRRRRAAARRADRPRRVDARTSRRASRAATRWCSNATTTSTCSRTATTRARSSSASRAGSAIWTTRRRPQLLARIDTSRLQHIIAAHLSQQNNTPDARARGAGRRARLRAGLDRHRRPGAGLRLARIRAERRETDMEKRQELYRARRRRSTRPTTRIGSSCTTATTSRRSTASSSPSSTEGRDQQQDQRVRDGQARRRRRCRRISSRC